MMPGQVPANNNWNPSMLKSNISSRHRRYLHRVVDLYHTVFCESSHTRKQLEDLGILLDLSILESSKKGVSNGSLRSMLPDTGKIINELQMIGILDENRQETFHGCITFPLSNHEGTLVGMVGYSFNDNNQQNLMLPGNHTSEKPIP